jgi:citrate synthase
MPDRNLSIVDSETGRTYQLAVSDGTVRATDFRSIKTSTNDFGLMVYDPGFMNTASCRSKVTYIDGDAGVLLYRGYPIEQLAEHADYLASLIWFFTESCRPRSNVRSLRRPSERTRRCPHRCTR